MGRRNNLSLSWASQDTRVVPLGLGKGVIRDQPFRLSLPSSRGFSLPVACWFVSRLGEGAQNIIRAQAAPGGKELAEALLAPSRSLSCPRGSESPGGGGSTTTWPKTSEESTPEQTYQCPYCKYSNPDVNRLRVHAMTQHSVQPVLCCPLCQDMLSNKIHLQLHLTHLHSVSPDCVEKLILTVSP
ncbi:UNVERIFIED_CONTAM: hypothetical protein K2H54_047287 [Gekko kuhli]